MAASVSQLTPFRGHFRNNDNDEDDNHHRSDYSKENSSGSSSSGSNSRRNSVSSSSSSSSGNGNGSSVGLSHYQPLYMDPLTDDDHTPVGTTDNIIALDSARH